MQELAYRRALPIASEQYKRKLLWELIAKPRCTSAPDFPPSLAGFCNSFADNILRQNLLWSGAGYQLRWTCKTNVLQMAYGIQLWYEKRCM